MGEFLFSKYFVMDFTGGCFYFINFPIAAVKVVILEAIQAALEQCL